MRAVLNLAFGIMGLLVGTVSSIDEAKCNQLADPGIGEKMALMYFYSADKDHCLPFHYSGEGGNDNRFPTDSACMAACSNRHAMLYPAEDGVCSLPKDQGQCHGRFVKFYYNEEEKTCRTFLYGGCGGNGNRFEDREECHITCAPKTRLGSSNSNPDAKNINSGLIAGIVGGCIFAVAIIATTVLFVQQRKSKTKDRKKVPTSVVEVEME